MRNLSVLALLAFAALSACTGSPATLAAKPAFEATTPFGLASVSIRETPFGMPWAEFEQAVRDGMEAEVRLQPAPQFRPFRHAGSSGTSTRACGVNRDWS